MEEEEEVQGSGDGASNVSQPARKSNRGRKARTGPIRTQLETGEWVWLSPKEYRSHRRCNMPAAYCLSML